MVLDEFHVLESHAGPVGERHSVACLDRAVGREGEDLSGPAGGENDRTAENRVILSGPDLERRHTLALALIHEELAYEEFVIPDDILKTHGVLKKGVQHVEAHFVSGIPRSLGRHAAEGPSGDCAVVVPAPRATPVFKQSQFGRGSVDEVLDHILIAEEVRPLDGIEAMEFRVVIVSSDRRGAAFCGHRVAPHRIDLGDQCDRRLGVSLCGFNRRSEPCPTAAHNHNIVPGNLYHSTPRE